MKFAREFSISCIEPQVYGLLEKLLVILAKVRYQEHVSISDAQHTFVICSLSEGEIGCPLSAHHAQKLFQALRTDL